MRNFLIILPVAFLFSVTDILGSFEKNETEVNVVLLGETTGGKTSIMQRLLEGKFTEDVKPTTGIEWHGKGIGFEGKENIFLKLWDIGGTCKNIAEIYYKNAGIVLFVYDITIGRHSWKY